MGRKGVGLRPGPSEWGKRRGAAGMSIRDLEALTGIHRATLSMLEHGRYLPTPDEARKILEALVEQGSA